MKNLNDSQISYGSTLILNDNVKYIKEDEKLEEFAKCCEYVCKLWKEIDDKH
jgi:hypothetical protein